MSSDEKSVLEDLMKVKDIKELWDSQHKSIQAGLLSGNDNFVIVAPTASGKTLSAELAILQSLRNNRKCLYLVPLSVLKTEKGEELGYLNKVWNYEISTKGDWKEADLVITTFESFYKAALLKTSIVEDFNLAVVDEFHVLYDMNRGFNLEKALTILKELGVRIICLSATFENKEEIKGWLDSELIVGAERSVPLVLDSIDLTQFSSSTEKMKCLYSTLLKSKDEHPILIFCNTRDNTRSRAKALCEFIKGSVKDPDKLREEMMNAISRNIFTSLEKELFACLCKRVAFHHSGLDLRLREFVVEKFKDKEVNFLFATTGLAYGVNFPAKTVVLCDLTIYTSSGMTAIPVYMFQQMAGRAGRPQFGKIGYAYVVMKTDADVKRAEKLLNGEIERAISHISVDDLFKKAILELIYSGKRQEEQIISFFENTFYNYQSINQEGLIPFNLRSILQKYLKKLIDEDFIEFMGAPGYRLTDLGDVTTQFLFKTFRLYTLEGFMRMNEYLIQQQEVTADFDLVYRLSKEFEGAKTYKYPRKKSSEIEDFFQLRGVAKPSHEEYSAYAVFYGWMENKPVYEIEEDFKVFGSALASVADEMLKMLVTYESLARKKRLTIDEEFNLLKDRLALGVREEEIPFAKLRGIGRDTVRKLSSWCKAVLRRPPFRYQGDMLSILIQFYESKNRDDNFLLTTLANSIEGFGPVRASKIVELIKTHIG